LVIYDFLRLFRPLSNAERLRLIAEGAQPPRLPPLPCGFKVAAEPIVS
jgi:hypothetical protein